MEFQPPSWSGLFREKGYEVVADEAFGQWQGDYVFVIREAYSEMPDFGVVVAGFGSCSYCDALQACGSQEDVDALFEQTMASVEWYRNAVDVQYWLLGQARNEMRWYAHEPGFEEALERLRAELDRVI